MQKLRNEQETKGKIKRKEVDEKKCGIYNRAEPFFSKQRQRHLPIDWHGNTAILYPYCI